MDTIIQSVRIFARNRLFMPIVILLSLGESRSRLRGPVQIGSQSLLPRAAPSPESGNARCLTRWLRLHRECSRSCSSPPLCPAGWRGLCRSPNLNILLWDEVDCSHSYTNVVQRQHHHLHFLWWNVSGHTGYALAILHTVDLPPNVLSTGATAS